MSMPVPSCQKVYAFCFSTVLCKLVMCVCVFLVLSYLQVPSATHTTPLLTVGVSATQRGMTRAWFYLYDLGFWTVARSTSIAAGFWFGNCSISCFRILWIVQMPSCSNHSRNSECCVLIVEG